MRDSLKRLTPFNQGLKQHLQNLFCSLKNEEGLPSESEGQDGVGSGMSPYPCQGNQKGSDSTQ